MKKEVIKKVLEELLLLIVPIYGISNFYESGLNKYSGVLILFLFIMLNKTYWNLRKEKNDFKFGILALLYSLFYVLGYYIDKDLALNHTPIFEINVLDKLLYIYSFGVASYIAIKYIYYRLDKAKEEDKFQKHKLKYYILVFVFFILAYIPYLIAFYPGLLSPDSMSQMRQAAGLIPLSNHHPIAHTMVIKLFYSIGELIGHTAGGVALYSTFQMCVSALIFTYMIYFFDKNGCNKVLKYLSIAFVGLVPLFGYYSVTMWKDILFGLFALFLTIQTYKFCFNKSLTKIDKIMIISSVILVSLFRSNGIFVTMLLGITLVIFMKSMRLLSLKLFLIPAIICVIITGPIYSAFGIAKTEFAETVGMPLRQFVGVAASGAKLDKESQEFMDNLIARDILVKDYQVYSFDYIKFNPNFHADYLNTNKDKFIKSYISSFFKHPIKFIEVYLKDTYGFWYIDAVGYGAHIWVMEKNEFGIHTAENSLTSKFITNYLLYDSHPILKYTQRPAVFLIAILLLFVFAVKKKKYKYILPILIPFFVWVTICLASPNSYQCRYVYALFTTFPFVLFVIYKIFKKEKI